MSFLAQRFECKYLVPTQWVPQLRAAFLPYVDPDPFAALQPDRSYFIHSIYLDSPQLNLYHAALQGERNRMKLRLRFYQDLPKTVFAEIKQRKADIIEKQRVPLTAEMAAQLAAGQLPTIAQSPQYTEQDDQVLLNFSRWSSTLMARPVSCVSYRREAWMGRRQDSQIRVTLDKQIHSEPRNQLLFKPARSDNSELFPGYWILELKYTDRFPEWFRELILRFGLYQRGAAKYVTGMRHRAE